MFEFFHRLFHRTSEANSSPTEAAKKTAQGMIWQCPECQAILGKEMTPQLRALFDGVSGYNTCPICGVSQSAADVYGGLFDVSITGRKALNPSQKELIKGSKGSSSKLTEEERRPAFLAALPKYCEVNRANGRLTIIFVANAMQGHQYLADTVKVYQDIYNINYLGTSTASEDVKKLMTLNDVLIVEISALYSLVDLDAKTSSQQKILPMERIRNSRSLIDELDTTRNITPDTADDAQETTDIEQRREVGKWLETKVYMHFVSKQSVLVEDMQDIDQISHTVMESIQQWGSFSPCNLTTSGYDEDPRGLWEIPEVRAWCKSAYAKAPHLPCILSERAISWYMPCILDIEIVKSKSHKLTPEEQDSIETIRRSNPQEAEKMRKMFESYRDSEFSVERTDAQHLLDETLAAGHKFFTQCRVSDVVVTRLMNEATERLRLCDLFAA